MSADVWAVPPMSYERIVDQPRPVWLMVEDELMNGWSGKSKDAYRLTHGHSEMPADGWLTFPVAKAANELGAPVRQLFTACMLWVLST